jgi:hypothetical protein
MSVIECWSSLNFIYSTSEWGSNFDKTKAITTEYNLLTKGASKCLINTFTVLAILQNYCKDYSLTSDMRRVYTLVVAFLYPQNCFTLSSFLDFYTNWKIWMRKYNIYYLYLLNFKNEVHNFSSTLIFIVVFVLCVQS